MKYAIENTNPLATKEFGELKEGDLFLYKNPVDSSYDLFMKMNSINFIYLDYLDGVIPVVTTTQYPPIKKIKNPYHAQEIRFNAVCLSNGVTGYFCENENIICVDYDLKIYKLYRNMEIGNGGIKNEKEHN